MKNIRLLSIFSSLIAVSMLVGGCGSNKTTAPILTYTLGQDKKTLDLVIVLGQMDTDPEGKILNEKKKEVTVKALYSRKGDSTTSVGVRRTVSVALDQPLGARKVMDASGKEIPISKAS